MSLLTSPILHPVFALIFVLLPWPGCRALATCFAVWAVRQLWRWWANLQITIDGRCYKGQPPVRRLPPRSAKTAQKTTKGRCRSRSDGEEGGFVTPNESDAESEGKEGGLPIITEWAPFAPSFPMGNQTTGSEPPSDGHSAAGSLCAKDPQYWLRCEASVFGVRNIRYKQTKEKVSSDFALYECVGMDMIRDKRRIDYVSDRLPCPGDLPKSCPGTREWSPSWGVPRVLIMNCQLPYTAGRLIGAHPEDDGGLSIVNYFVLSPRASTLLATDSPTPAMRLWKRFVEEGISTKDGISLKVVGRVEDLDKHEVPEHFKGFNNKPVLLTKSSSVFSNRLPEVMEIGFDVRSWIYPARSALANYHDRAGEAEVEVGYLLEGKTDEELPEQILGCFQVNNLDITAARWISSS
eukprot:TRINITY_DN22778_c0_g1_i1.p1 TRINITY_DN22778_c0_g1~~TRINITY_DN22778_c0_g1_i1.p1  ORF type:complete len:407 (-),score=52.95 TRINITY_DN22778_c0_g1_i1:45-1265(-)